MNKEKAIRVAAYLRELLKDKHEAVTVVMTKDIIADLYEVAKVCAIIEEKIEEDRK